MATRVTYKTEVQKEVDDTSTTNVTLINNIIRDIYQEIAIEIAPYINGEESEDVTVTSATITPTKSWQEIRKVYYKATNTWEELSRVKVLDLNDTGTSPSEYSIRGNTIVLNGSPTSGTVRVSGIEVVAELDDDSEVSIIPDRYSRVVNLGCVARFLGYEKDPAAAEYFSWYLQAKRAMLDQLINKTEVLRPPLY
jgi:hypothetical protein